MRVSEQRSRISTEALAGPPAAPKTCCSAFGKRKIYGNESLKGLKGGNAALALIIRALPFMTEHNG
jgi:hypothetical protein